jgi:hypothetical protein
MALLVTGIILALLRLGFASRFWRQTTGQRRLFYEIFLSDFLIIWAYIKALFSRTLVWGGIKFRVLSGGRMVRLD